MDRIEDVYARAPLWAQNAMCTLEGLRIRVRRFPPSFGPLLTEVEARMAWTRAQTTASRLARLRSMLVHAGRRVPYWRELFDELKFRPARLQHEDELLALPVLTKDIVVAEGDRMRAEDVPSNTGAAILSKTSGTTGAGLVFALSESAVQHQWAVCWRFRHWHGLSRDTWCAQLGGRVVVPLSQRGPPFHRVNVAGRQVLLSGYHLSASTAPEYLDQIERRRLPWIHGYPSLVVLLADAARERKWPWLRWITLASETVTDTQRQRIEEGFGIRPVEHYAQTEAVANASERPDGHLYIDDDFSVVELLRDSAFPKDTSVRRIVGTSLDNWHMPFIRYDTGDLATVAEDGVYVPPGRRVLAIDGRREDYVELDDGTLIGRTDHIFKTLTFVREAQIRQRHPGAVAIHVVPRGPWTDDADARLRHEVAARLGGNTDVDIVLEQRLPRTESGKLRLVVREGGG